MRIKARVRQGIVILDLSGKINADSANFIEAVSQCIRDNRYNIICNFEDIDGIDYMGISVIVIAYKEMVNNKGRMKFINIPVHLRGMFSISGLDRAIEIYTSEDIAINSFKEDRVIENIKKLQLRRKFKRLPIDIKIEIRPKHLRRAVCLKADILDLSGIGAYIFGCEEFKLGDELVLKIKLPQREKPLELDARVVWLSDKEVQRHIHPGMGVEFYNIASDIQQEIIAFIERNLSSLEK